MARYQAHPMTPPDDRLRLRDVATFLVGLAAVFVILCGLLWSGPVA